MKAVILKKFDLILSLALLLWSVWFNLDLYRLEPTVSVDPNDNNFQFALVDRANTVWSFAQRKCAGKITYPVCHLSYMADHWVGNWAQGYNLPFYYSHVPQIAIVGSYRAFTAVGLLGGMSLFNYYHWVIYLLLCLFPIPVFLAARVIGLPWLAAATGAVFATHISTDGLYGIDPPSFLWRGWGLSSQLFAMIFMPLSLAYSFRYLAQPEQKSVGTPGFELFRQLRFILPFLPDRSTSAGSVSRTASLRSGHDQEEASPTPLSRLFWPAVVFTVLTIMGHLGIGVMTMLSLLVFAFTPALVRLLKQDHWREILDAGLLGAIRLTLLSVTVISFLGYWIIPTFLSNDYHNVSFWDPIWKFNSFGWKEILIRLFNGDLLDFGRFPVLTVLAFVGAFLPVFIRGGAKNGKNGQTAVVKSDDTAVPSRDSSESLFAFSLLFVFWILLYFGRTTWKGLIDLIPSMSEFHMSRFIVGLHSAAIFLFPIAVMGISRAIADILKHLIYPATRAKNAPTPAWLFTIAILSCLAVLVPPVYRQTEKYNELNDRLIVQANENMKKQAPAADEFFGVYKTLPPGRVFAGRGGGWGKDFRVAETEMFMYISTFGVPTALWLPETWSPNSDTEQYFSEDQAKDYDLYNLRYVLAPLTVKPQSFWKERQRNPFWILYDVDTSGYFTVGTRSLTVVTDKTSFANIVRLWIQSKIPTQKLFPEIRFSKLSDAHRWPVPWIRMEDEVTYLTSQGKRQNIWEFNPLPGGDGPKAELVGPEYVDADMVFRTKVNVEKDCRECLVILKQTYHPNWKATVDGKPVATVNVFPFHVAVPLDSAGTHEIVVWYQPMPFKTWTMSASILAAFALLLLSHRTRLEKLLNRKSRT